jgi:hypothetical protein
LQNMKFDMSRFKRVIIHKVILKIKYTPPLKWGKYCRFRRTDVIPRNTPTHVGKDAHVI